MIKYNLNRVEANKIADAKEWSVARHYGITRTAHDSKPYNVASDVETGDKNISVKSSKFTLMSGSFCKGLSTMDEIWTLYETTTHSDTVAYVTEDFDAYEMTITEFKVFVYTFCSVQKESAKNGGTCKIRCRAETKKMVEWLQARA